MLAPCFVGRLDRVGISILVPLTVISALFAPLVFLGNYWLTLIGSALWVLVWGYTNRLFQRLSP